MHSVSEPDALVVEIDGHDSRILRVFLCRHRRDPRVQVRHVDLAINVVKQPDKDGHIRVVAAQELDGLARVGYDLIHSKVRITADVIGPEKISVTSAV